MRLLRVLMLLFDVTLLPLLGFTAGEWGSLSFAAGSLGRLQGSGGILERRGDQLTGGAARVGSKERGKSWGRWGEVG